MKSINSADSDLEDVSKWIQSIADVQLDVIVIDYDISLTKMCHAPHAAASVVANAVTLAAVRRCVDTPNLLAGIFSPTLPYWEEGR